MKISYSEKQVRMIRFFLPRLHQEELSQEIFEEKSRINEDYKEKECTEIAPLEKERNDLVFQKKTKRLALFFLLVLLVGSGFAIYYGIQDQVPFVVILLGSSLAVLSGIGSIVLLLGGRELALKIDSLKSKIEALQRQLQEEMERRLANLNAKLDELIVTYEGSIASEEEMVEYINKVMRELSALVAVGLGIEEQEILDDRCAEIWTPAFFQQINLDAVQKDIQRSELDFYKLRDDIIKPMRPFFDRPDQWESFRQRVLKKLDLASRDKTETDTERLNALSAIRYSQKLQTYLAGYYFYQKIVCTETFVGVFRAYFNMINNRIAHTFSLQISYKDVVAVGIETSLNVENFIASRLTIDQHIKTLSLSLTSSEVYRMSGDAGSSAWVESADDKALKKVVSRANTAFQNQIQNIRALIREHNIRDSWSNG